MGWMKKNKGGETKAEKKKRRSWGRKKRGNWILIEKKREEVEEEKDEGKNLDGCKRNERERIKF